MDTIQKKVKITLSVKINDQGQLEDNTSTHIGNYYRKGNMDVLTYEENIEDTATINNFITIQADKVSIKRTGVVSMTQKFRTNQITENIYKHPHGSLHMETFTDTITHQQLDEHGGGHVSIFYKVKLNGQEERAHKLVLHYKEEDSQ